MDVKIKPDPKAKDVSVDDSAASTSATAPKVKAKKEKKPPAPKKPMKETKPKAEKKVTVAKKEQKPAKKKKDTYDFGGKGKDMRSSSSKSKSQKAYTAITESCLNDNPEAASRAELKSKGQRPSVGVPVIIQDKTRYIIDIAPTGRAICKASHTVIPKGALRWSVKKDGISLGGYRRLDYVTPKMLRSAIEAHGSIDLIHGFGQLEDEARRFAINTLKHVILNGGIKTKKGKKQAKAEEGVAGDDDEEGELDEEDDEIMEMASLTLDQMLAQKFESAMAAGDVMELDMSDDDEPATSSSSSSSSSTTQPKPPAPKPIVMEKVKPLLKKKPPVKKNQKPESDSEDDDDYDDNETDLPPAKPDREPVPGDLLLITFKPDPATYVCALRKHPDGKLAARSVDGSFASEKPFDSQVNDWSFSIDSQKSAPAKSKMVIAADPRLLKEAATKKVKEKLKTGKPLEGMRFVISGQTEEYPGDEFPTYVKGLIEGAGGVCTTGVSGKTDYLVVGTTLWNSFLRTIKPIEEGSKYVKAMTCTNCSIIEFDQLEEMIESVVDGGKEEI